jgi:outer membrane protein TolC
LQAKVIADIDRAAAGYRVARENLAGVATLLDGQQKLRETAEAQLRAGAADQLELLNVQLELGAGELTRLDGQVKAQQAAAALEDAVQRPFDFSGGRNSAASLIDIVGSAPEASVVPLAKETAVKPDPPKP